MNAQRSSTPPASRPGRAAASTRGLEGRERLRHGRPFSGARRPRSREVEQVRPRRAMPPGRPPARRGAGRRTAGPSRRVPRPERAGTRAAGRVDPLAELPARAAGLRPCAWACHRAARRERPRARRGTRASSRRTSVAATVAAERREPVVAPALVVELRVGPLVALLDEAIGEEALDRGVDRPGPSFTRPSVIRPTSCMIA